MPPEGRRDQEALLALSTAFFAGALEELFSPAPLPEEDFSGELLEPPASPDEEEDDSEEVEEPRLSVR
jgi:hypothetical protein